MSFKLRVETFLYILVLLLLYFMQYQSSSQAFVDTDNYMHVMRTIDFMHSPSMAERLFEKTNYPFGEISHWTRLMDILMSICALPFLLFKDLKEAVFAGGFILTPLCAIGTLYFLQKIGEQWFDAKARFALYAILLMSTPFEMVFRINRPDHHAVIICFSACLFWLLCKYLNKPEKKTLYSAAFVCALSLWLAVEGIFLYSCTLLFLYFGYVFFEFSFKNILRFSGVYAAFVTLFCFLNPPLQGYFYADNGRISFLFVVLALAAFVIIYIADKIKHKLKQFIFLALCGLGCLSCLYFGEYFNSPMHPDIAVAFTNRISEMRSGNNVYHMAYPCLGLIFIFVIFLKRRNLADLLLLACFLLPYVGLSIFAMRFCSYAVLFGAIAIAYWLKQKHFGFIKYSLMLVLLCLTEFIAFSIDAIYRYDLSKPIDKPLLVNMRYMAQYNFPEGAIVSDVFLAPQIIWYTDKPSVASPYHRNVEGIIDNHKILHSSDMSEVVKLIKKHQVGTIVLPVSIDSEYYYEPEKNTDKLYGKILSEHIYPEWLEEDKSARAHNLIILRVLKDKLP